MHSYDYVIIGSGIAGLYCALLASQHGSVLVLTKGTLDECNTRYAQGGIAAAVGPGDSADLHFQDTMAAGAGLSDPEMARILAEEAADRIHDLVALGVPFDTVHGEIALAREGAHSLPRVLHAGGDATGEHIELTLGRQARESNVAIHEHCMAIDLLRHKDTVVGVRVQDASRDQVLEFDSRNLILATGGAGRLFKFTTNSPVATGDGVALAYRAGADIMDMEFYQFHPTALRLPGVPTFLISEAVRGEGGILRNHQGRRFMLDYHPKAELAPRDVVARAIVSEMRRSGSESVLLDITHLSHQAIITRFPHIYHFCLQHGLDITTSPIPVAPAAHYMMGGVKTDGWGATSVRGLLACGETACTAVHGANRLASNSLLETLIFGKRIVQHTVSPAEGPPSPFPNRMRSEETFSLPERQGTPEPRGAVDLAALQSVMWEHVGIVRSGQDLQRTVVCLAAWERVLSPSSDVPALELRNMVLTARLIAEAALLRTESRGAHYRTDFPESSPQWLRHIVFRAQ